MTTEPPLDHGTLVRPLFVADQEYVKPCRNAVVDAVEELADLDCAMTLATLTDHAAGLHVEGCEESRRAVAHIVVRATGPAAGLVDIPYV